MPVQQRSTEGIKALVSCWKGLLHCFQTTGGKGRGMTKRQAEKQKRQKAQRRNEEKIGKRVIRKKNNRGKLGKRGTNTCTWEIRQCRNRED